MTPQQYIAARDALGWTHAELARVLGTSDRTLFRWQAGKTGISKPEARLLRLLVRLRFTLPTRRFEEIIREMSISND